jgi:hypothetical protein
MQLERCVMQPPLGVMPRVVALAFGMWMLVAILLGAILVRQAELARDLPQLPAIRAVEPAQPIWRVLHVVHGDRGCSLRGW